MSKPKKLHHWKEREESLDFWQQIEYLYLKGELTRLSISLKLDKYTRKAERSSKK